jgi:hypothetical protein
MFHEGRKCARTHDEFDDGVVERLVLHLPGLFDEIKHIIDERIVEYSCQ